ncbi:MAG: vWA domain-containing protein [Roseiarcus sp.]
MFLSFFAALRQAHVPVTPREYLDLMRALEADLADKSVDDFYRLSRALLVKDERNLDKFDVVFAASFKGVSSLSQAVERQEIPEEWLRKLAERYLSPKERAEIEKLGFDKLMETLRQRLAEQSGRHQGGSKWIGTGGTSPFGAYGDHPEGVRIGQDRGRRGSAVKVWDRREFKDLSGDEELGPRNIRIALRRLRRFAREGAAEELDLDGTVRSTADKGYIDVRLRPERRNAVKVLLFLDVGGSMDWHVEAAENLFAAARLQFKRLEHFYFHNCLYESVWKNNRRRFEERTPTMNLLNAYGRDHRVIFVGDAAMSPHEILAPGGSVEHLNPEPGEVWLRRVAAAWPRSVWINPTPPEQWPYSQSTRLISALFEHRMFALTPDGIEAAMRALTH